MDQERFKNLFTKYLQSEATEQELNELTIFLDSGVYKRYAEQLLDQCWTKSSKVEMDYTVSQSILENIFASAEKKNRYKKSLQVQVWTTAAAILALISVAVAIHFVAPMPDVLQTVNSTITKQQHAANAIVYHTSDAHRKVNLPDGSTVILNNQSTLSFGSDFNKKSREVHLVGEGYFDIKHHRTKPFIVTSGSTRTTVLGTAFNVSAYPSRKVEITVTRGKVSVLSGQKVVGILTPNKKIVVPGTMINPVISSVIAEHAIEWQAHDLYFDNISFEEAAALLSKKFDVPIQIADHQARQCRFTATFLQGESLDDILRIICSFNNSQYNKSRSGIIISGPGC